jgi:hypothetical protein
MIHVKVKLKGRDAARYLGQLSAPGADSPAPRIQIEKAPKKRLVVLRRGKH